MKPDDYNVLPLPVFIVSTKNGRIIESNPLAMNLGFKKDESFYDMLEDKAVFNMLIKDETKKATIVIDNESFLAAMTTVFSRLNDMPVVLIVVTSMENAKCLREEDLISLICEAYIKNTKNPLYDFLRITARGNGAFCAALYEIKNGRYTICDEWRDRKSICVPLLSANFDNAAAKEIERLRSLKRAEDVIHIAYKKAHGTKGVAVYFYDSQTDIKLRARTERFVALYKRLEPDFPKNSMTALIKGLETIEQSIAVWDADTRELLYENKAFREKFGSGSALLLINRVARGASPAVGHSVYQSEVTGQSYSINQTKIMLGRRKLMTTVISDVTRYKKAENKLEMLAKTDVLTGLNNRRAGLEILEAAYIKCKKEKKPLTVCFADIDGLKRINDTYGHGVGDNMIRTVAGILKKYMGVLGEVCRLGGDEFLLILPGSHKPQAILVASRIEQAISRTFISGSQNISMSFGFKEADYDANETVYTLINVADSDMYSKKHGKA